MNPFKYFLLLLSSLFSLILEANSQILYSQSDRFFISIQNTIYSETLVQGNTYKDYTVDLSSAKFKQNPQILYTLTVYNVDDCANQGFTLQNQQITSTTLTYRLTSLGCDLNQLHFNVFAIDDANVEILQLKLKSGEISTIKKIRKIIKIGAFIFGFKGTSSNNMILKQIIERIDDYSFKVSFSNSNISEVHLNFVIVYESESSGDIVERLYSYEITSDQQGRSLPDKTDVFWQSSTLLDSSKVLFGLKDFNIKSNGYYGVKILSGQSPEAQNKNIRLIYFTWNGYKVNMVNGIYMGLSVQTCSNKQYMFLNSTYHACTSSCSSVDHHYNNNPAIKKELYRLSIPICQICNSNCYGCKDGLPDQCTDCYNGKYFNPFTNKCQDTKPESTVCSQKIIGDQTYYNCIQCDLSCQECDIPKNPKECTQCNLATSNKYFYLKQCLTTQPVSTYCDRNLICKNCDPNCTSCVDSSSNCQACKANKYLYQNTCLDSIIDGIYCNSATDCKQCNLSKCLTCFQSDSNCTGCKQNQYLFNNTCLDYKPTGVYCKQKLDYNECFMCTNPLCQECTEASKSICLSCQGNNYLYKGQCYQDQPEGTYCISNVCNDCHTSCKSCSGAESSDCIVCNDNRDKIDFYCKCSTGFYEDNNKTCQSCDASCKSCSGGSQSQCLSCSDSSQYLYDGQCVSTPPQGTYCDDSIQQCYNCNSICKECQGPNLNNCLECFSGFNFNPIDHTCQCPDNQYPEVTSGVMSCLNCHASCKTCDGSSSQDCLSCDVYLFNKQCFIQQPDRTYCDSDKICKECNTECKSCDISLNNCISCFDTYFKDGSTCLKCSEFCGSCSGQSSTQCTSCRGTLDLQIDGQCGCSQGKFINNSNVNAIACDNCHSSCEECTGPNSNQCNSCQKNSMFPYFYKNECLSLQKESTFCDEQKICQDCYQNCKSCNGKAQNECTVCVQDKFFYNGQCLDNPPNKTFCIENICKDCDNNCEQCQNSSTECTSCKQNEFLFKNTCYQQQPDKTYCTQSQQNSKYQQCTQCDISCNQCSGLTSSDCIECQSDKYLYKNQCLSSQPDKTYCLKNNCFDCDQECLSCTGPSNKDCIQCQGSKIISKETKLCECQTGQYLSDPFNPNSECLNCQSGCEKCSSNTFCEECSNNFFQYKQQCLQTQPDKTYCVNQKCFDCHSDCFACQGPDANNCTQCYGDQIVDPLTQKCFCPQGTYLDSQDQNSLYICSKCSQGCIKCQNSYQCDVCDKSLITNQQLYSYDNECSEEQPRNTYCDNITFSCQQCKVSCQQCDYSLEKCTSCKPNEYLYKGSCSSTPPNRNGIFCSKETLICEDCNENCFNCQEESNKCVQCLLEEFLFQNKCYKQQPQGSSCIKTKINNNNQQFLACDQCQANNCMSCNKQTTTCNKCIEGSKLDTLGQSCECPEGFYKSFDLMKKENFCKQCSQKYCSKCDDNTCQSCLSGFYLNNKNQCTYCSNNMYANDKNQCILSCRKGCEICTSSNSCIKKREKLQKCHESCQTCNGPTENDCLSCSSNTRIFDIAKNTCNCKPNYNSIGNIDCKYIYQVDEKIASTHSALNIAEFSLMSVSTVTNFLPGMSYSFGLMQIIGNFYIKQDESYTELTSVLSPYTKYNLNSLFQQKIQQNKQNEKQNQQKKRILDNETVYPIPESDDQFIIVDRIYFADNSYIQLSLISFIFLIAQAFHFYQTRTKKQFRYINVVRWNLVLFTIQLSSNFMVLTLFQCKFADQRIIDWVFLCIFTTIYAIFNLYVFRCIKQDEHKDPSISILSDGLNQKHVYTKFFFIIFEMRKLIFCLIIAMSKGFLNFTIWLICLIQAIAIVMNQKQKVFTNKASNIILITTEVLFLLIITLLGVMINIKDNNTNKTIATCTVFLMMTLSLFTILALIYLFSVKIKQACLNKKINLQNNDLNKLNAKVKFIESTIDIYQVSQQVKWNINPIKRKSGSNSSDQSVISDETQIKQDKK